MFDGVVGGCGFVDFGDGVVDVRYVLFCGIWLCGWR